MTPLVVRSHYSLMQGVSSPERICERAASLGYKRLALTDTDNLYGLWHFLEACERNCIRPIVGAELTDPASNNRAVCLVKNKTGYRNLCRLITMRHRDSTFRLASFIPRYEEGLFVLTGVPELLRSLAEKGIQLGAALSGKPDSNGFRIRKLARALGLSSVAIPDSFFIRPMDFKLHRILRAIDRNTSLSRLEPGDTVPDTAWLAGPDEYRTRFSVWPDAVDATEEIADTLLFTGPENRIVMPPWKDDQANDQADGPVGADSCPPADTTGIQLNSFGIAEAVLRKEAYRGAFHRYGDDLPETVTDRLEHELDIITGKGFSSYFLVVRDIVKQSPRICGRGSGAASLVAFCLGITNICPVRYNLYFERFMNPDRQDPPDIDVDFAWDERDSVIDTVLKTFSGHAAMVCTHVLLKPRMAIREVAKVFGLSGGEISRVTKRLPWFWRFPRIEDDARSDIRADIQGLPETGKFDFCEPWPEILEIAGRIIGTPRHLSVHSGGVIITPEPIDRYVPVETAATGVPIIQWDKDGAEEGGLVKIDLLGNRSLAVIRDAISNMRKNDMSFDEEVWVPEEDISTQNAVANGRTMGCFYIESPATRLLQQKAGTGDFEHLVIHSSIIRPAANDAIHEYLRRLHGAPWQPIHPLMGDLLDETYGIMVYQEDVSKTAVSLAGFSHAEADGLRRILSKKDKTRKLQDYKERFVKGAVSRNVSKAQIDEVWDMILSFSGYSFCKPHSASYARVSFQAAYLKTHYPAEFMAAVISNRGGYYSTFAYVSEARRMGIEILSPDVNQSEIRWQGHDHFMRAGLMAVHALSANTMERIVGERRKGMYSGILDFFERVAPDKDEARFLLHAGAFDSISPDKERAQMLWEVIVTDKMKSRSAGRQKDQAGQLGQPDLFRTITEIPIPSFPLELEIKRLRREFSVLGFLCGCHPIVLYEDVLKKKNMVKAVDMRRFVGQRIHMAGFLVTGKRVRTKHGDPMEFVTFEDDTGLVETVFFPDAYNRFCSKLYHKGLFVLDGKVEEDFGACTLTVFHLHVIRSPKNNPAYCCDYSTNGCYFITVCTKNRGRGGRLSAR